jgi:hypothetical protein
VPARPIVLSALLAALALPSLAGAQRVKAVDACKLLTRAQVEQVLGHPVDIRHGATITNCVIRGGSLAPIVAVTTTGGKTAYRRILRATGAKGTPLRLGSQAIAYQTTFGDPMVLTRGVIVRKDAAVLHMSTSGVGDDPAGLPALSQIVRLARFATARL